MQKKRRAHQAHEEDNMTSTCCFVISRSAVRVREVALTRGTCAEPTALHKDPQDPPTLPQGTNTTTHRTSCGNAAGLDPSTTRHTLRHAFGTALADVGLTAEQIAPWMGHTSAASSAVYIHLTAASSRRHADAVARAVRGEVER